MDVLISNVHMRRCLCGDVWVCLWMGVCVTVHVDMCGYVHAYVSRFVDFCGCGCMDVCVDVWMFADSYVWMCGCVCECVHVACWRRGVRNNRSKKMVAGRSFFEGGRVERRCR